MAHKNIIARTHAAALAVAVLATGLFASAANAGPDDDAPSRSDGNTRNAADPIYFGGKLADFMMNAEAETGLRVLPPTGTELFAGQRFDLRIETQIPAQTAPTLVRLSLNGRDMTEAFIRRIAKQGSGPESGAPQNELLFGASARNLSFDKAGRYELEAVVAVGGTERHIVNRYAVAAAPNPNALGAARKVIFFLGDGTGLPLRTAARIVSKGAFEGRVQDTLAMEKMPVHGISRTTAFDSIITDSAPGMGSPISGMKQSNNALQVAVDNTPENPLDNPRIETVFEYMKRVHGWKIGVVTDAFLVDATPAVVQAHNRSRRNYLNIAQQMIGYYDDNTELMKTGYTSLAELSQPLDVLMGGGAAHWMSEKNPDLKTFYQYGKGGRKDVDLMADIAPAKGYSVVRNLEELRAAPAERKLLGIFTGEFRTTSSGLGGDNLPGTLDRLVARGAATIRGKGANDPEIGMNVAPPQGTGCGATVADCFRKVPMKTEMVDKAISVLDTLAAQSHRRDGGWMLLVEQSQPDKFGHILEYDRAIYDVIELDQAVAATAKRLAADKRALMVLTADHAQPQTIIGVALTGALVGQAGSCFTTADGNYPITLGSTADKDRPCALQDAIGTFNDATFPTYEDKNGDGFPDDPDPSIKLIVEDGGHPTYSTTFLTNYQPLQPNASRKADDGKTIEQPAVPNPTRQPEGLLMTGNMPTRNVKGGANKTSGAVDIAPHSGDDVLVSAQGAGASHFAGYYENTGISVRLARAMGGDKAKRISAAAAKAGTMVGW
jgi:alkaline phosphatase